MDFNKYPLPEWTHNKPLIPIILHLISIFCSESAYEIFKDTDSYFKKWDISKIPSLDEWLSFYTKDQILLTWLSNWILEELKDPIALKFVLEIFRFFKDRLKYLRETPDIFEPPFTKELLLNFANWLDRFDLNEFEFRIENKSSNKIDNKFNKSPMLIFILRSWLPCVFYFGETPQALFKKAISGNFEALCKLIRLDKTVLKNDEILRIFQEINLNPDSKKCNTLLRSFSTPIKIDSKKKIKEIVATLISLSSTFTGIRLTAPQVQDLFDYVARIKNSDKQVDTDLGTPEAFAKHIQRKSAIYKNFFLLDIK